MRWKQFVLWILAMGSAVSGIAASDVPTDSLLFRQWVVQRTRFSIVGGRVVSSNGAWMIGIPRQISNDGPVHEQIDFNGNGVSGSFAYSYQRKNAEGATPNEPRVRFGVEMNSENRFFLRYSDTDHPDRYFALTQVPGQSLALSLPPSDKPRVLRAPTIWHFLIIDTDDCRKQFLPLLEAIRPAWHLGLTAQAAEDELVKMAAVSQKSDRKQWEAWVRQLGDPELWTKRNRAEQKLRAVGPAVLGYLNRLNMNQFDAEQQSRLRHIIRDLSTQTDEDTPQHVASMLIEDPLVWLALLSRPEESTRRAAVQQLALLVDVPINVDPKAEPDTQAKARDALRVQIEKIVGEGNKPDSK